MPNTTEVFQQSTIPQSSPEPETQQSDAEKKAEALRLREERAADAAVAMQEYEDEKAKMLENTQRLRALRLAREAEEKRLKSEKTPKLLSSRKAKTPKAS
ncbi:MAG TPA: hypothetical protein VN229_19390 [Terriglobales bacterium]|nr:hypothetical protein [Terriglobales bacterium]